MSITVLPEDVPKRVQHPRVEHSRPNGLVRLDPVLRGLGPLRPKASLYVHTTPAGAFTLWVQGLALPAGRSRLMGAGPRPARQVAGSSSARTCLISALLWVQGFALLLLRKHQPPHRVVDLDSFLVETACAPA